ncbi:MlaD family protein [Gordonia sp. (in: high G+C Gram-positive bacteria)]|uniref:MlaD family protein n=1 Tax=Gordonia sp. (in: high G+C Gram-positive bacteria) TaxID=84139 RepID=UPI003342B8FD
MIKLPSPVTLLLLALITVLGSAYIGFGVLKIDPLSDRIRVTAEVAESGGLMDNSEVTLRGVHIGEVTSVQQIDGGLSIRMELDEGAQVPLNAKMRIANLSAAGEQFVDFTADRLVGPYLTDGSRVARQNIRVGSTVAESLANIDALTGALDPAKVSRLVDNVQRGLDGRRDDFAKMMDATTRFSAMLRDKRVEVRELYRNVQILGDRFDGYGPKVGAAARDIGEALPDVLFIIREFKRYSYVGEKVWQDPFSPLVDKLDEYCKTLCPDFALVAAMLKPVTRELRGTRADIGQLMRAMTGIFPGDSMRVAVTVPTP